MASSNLSHTHASDDELTDVEEGGSSRLTEAVRKGKSPRVLPRVEGGVRSVVDPARVSKADIPIDVKLDNLFAAALGKSDTLKCSTTHAWRTDMPPPFSVSSDLNAARIVAPVVAPTRVSVTPLPRVSVAPVVASVGSPTVSASGGNVGLASSGTVTSELAGSSYASILKDATSSSGNDLSFFPLAEKSSSKIELPLELLKKASITYQNTLYGYFLGPRLYFPTVVKEVKKLWGKMGFQEAMMNDNGFLFFRFSSVDGLRQVMEGGPWMIRGVPLFVFPWDPMQGLVKPEHKTCPLWVKLHNIPLVAFNREGVGRIASALGKPKMMDEFTTSMCDNAWGRPGFAKVLVDVWAVGELKRELDVVVPNLYGGKGTEVKIRVEYLWEPIQCSHCSVFGHKLSSCVKATVAKSVSKGKEKEIVDDDGFTKIQNRKQKGIVISGQSSKITKQPKPKQVYAPVKPKQGDSSTGLSSSSAAVGVSSVKDSVVPSSASPINLEDSPTVVEKIPILDQSLSSTDDVAKTKHLAGMDSVAKLKEYLARQGNDISMFNKFSSLESLDTDVITVENQPSPSVLETHLGVSKLPDVASAIFGAWSWNANQVSCPNGVRILFGWDALVMDVMVISLTDQVVHCKVLPKGSSKFFHASFVYASNNLVTRRQLWNELKTFSVVSSNCPWAVLGDFNATLQPEESMGGSNRRDIRMEEFLECLEDSSLFDIRFQGNFFTWAQKPTSGVGILRKLDRVLVNTDFSDSFHLSSARFLPRAQRSDFLSIVSDAWRMSVHGTYMYCVLQKLKHLKPLVRSLSSHHGPLSENVKTMRLKVEELQNLVDANPYDISLQDNLSSVTGKFQEALWLEDSYFRQRAKCRWLQEGDLNTAYFHKAVKERKNRSLITSILDVHGMEASGDSIGVAFENYFKSMLGERDAHVIPDIPEDFFSRKLSIEDANYMIRPITKEEVKLAMFDIGDDRAPGSDGYTSKFFKSAWSIIGSDVILAIQDFFYRGRLARQVNHTAICLLPKHPHASRVTEFRPISLCNVLYKCIAKIISWRIKDSLDFLVSSSQSAFIPGRGITDNILLAHELMEGYGRQHGTPRCAFKIDIQKAYDSVDWWFLCTLLDRMGFHPIMRHWIMELVSTTSYSLIINGEPTGFFKGGRGLRQGCPLSPYLFTLVMEAFSSLFRRQIGQDHRFSFHKGCAELAISHLCFADDLMVFSKGDLESVTVLKEVLDSFATLSGLKPNIAKSSVYFSNVDPNTVQGILNILPFQTGNLPFRYLGVPLSSKRLVVSDFESLIIKVKSRIQNWKSKCLSFGGRLLLVRSVLESLQLYWMAVFLLPSSVTHKIEKMFRDFLWAQSNSATGKCRVAWSDVCKPKQAGGLGIKRLNLWNRSLLVSHIWDILRRKNSLWVTWIRSFRLRNSHFWNVQIISNSSWIWRKLLDLREQVRPHFLSVVGDGLSTNAWDDKWIVNGTLSLMIPFRIFQSLGLSKHSTVADVIQVMGSAWPTSWIDRMPSLSGVAVPNLQIGVKDQIMWLNLLNQSRNFAIKEVWNSLLGPWQPVLWHDLFWRLIRDDLGNTRDGDWSLIVQDLIHRRWNPGEVHKKCLFVGGIYYIWQERNRRLFEGRKRDPSQLVRDLRMFLDTRKNGLRDVHVHCGEVSGINSTT
ncbi:hypothetical protein OSB04_028754 [Centaurea solstitialis]|uniref:Reverse transcriptase domain-containing protein n=1 Tax=Centaurea solstitialis TaxID=347529 RepID=A0AA38SH46_9ASTR|nr:hypothetical protein OSB04_028754 [Centaurea solstitialis]